MRSTATLDLPPIFAAATPEDSGVIANDARGKTSPSREVIISPFPGLIYVAEVGPDEDEFHWSAVVPFVVAVACVMALLVFGPKFA